MEVIKNTLQQLGLNENEVVVYLALLTIGQGPASALAKRTGLQRSTAQYTCQQLLNKGVISKVEQNNTYVYRSEDPRRLIGLLAKKRSVLNAQEERVENILGLLREMMQPNITMPKIRTYEGIDQIRVAYQNVLETAKPHTTMYSYVQPLPHTKENKPILQVLDDFTEARIRKNIVQYMLIPACPEATEFASISEQYKWHIRELPVRTKKIQPSEVLIVQNTIWSLSVESGHFFAYSIEHASLVDLQKEAYLLAWNAATEIPRQPVSAR